MIKLQSIGNIKNNYLKGEILMTTEKTVSEKFAEFLENMDKPNPNEFSLKDTTNEVSKIITKIEEFDKERRDILVNLKALKMLDNGSLITQEGQSLVFGSYSLTQFCTFLGIPGHYIKKLLTMNSKLVADQINFFLQRYEDEQRVFRLKGNRIQGIVSQKYVAFDDKEVLTLFDETTKSLPKHEITNFVRNDKYMHMRVTFPELTRNYGLNTKGKEDIIRVCVDIYNSEVGASAFRARTGTFRLVCTNGMLAPAGDVINFHQRHSAFEPEVLKTDFRKGILSSVEEGKQLLEKMDKSRNIKVVSPYETIERLSEKAGLSKKQVVSVKNNFDEEPEQSLYGILNSFTATARDFKNNEARLKLEEFSGKILEDKKILQLVN